jgi:chorismate synthase
MTVLLVAAGVVAKKILQNVDFESLIVEIGGSRNIADFQQIIEAAMRDGDSVGGVVECRAKGVKVGLGEPFFDSAESVISHLLFSVPAVKGVEFGSGFEGVRLRGSERNDCFVDGEGHTATNNEGGINGGITNGNELVVRAAIKPTPSISCPQMTYNKALGEVAPLQIKGRHDACIVLRAAVVVESVVAIALAELTLNS